MIKKALYLRNEDVWNDLQVRQTKILASLAVYNEDEPNGNIYVA